jgi:hypothetical protein
MACTHDHSGNLPKAKIEALEDSQRDFWRHKCAGCAYEMGRADASTAEANLRRRVQELQARVEQLEAELKK